MFTRIPVPENLHDRVTRTLALRILEAEHASQPLVLPIEAELCQQLGVSRTVVREAVKVLVDKGMLEVRPRTGTRSKPRRDWNLLDPDVLAWQSTLEADAHLLRDLCEVRLAIEPTAAGFAALRATPEELKAIEVALENRKAKQGETVELDVQFLAAIVAACHNPLLAKLSSTIGPPLRAALSHTTRLQASEALALDLYHGLVEAIRRRDPLQAKRASEEVVGLAMLAVEEVIRAQKIPGRKPKKK